MNYDNIVYACRPSDMRFKFKQYCKCILNMDTDIVKHLQIDIVRYKPHIHGTWQLIESAKEYAKKNLKDNNIALAFDVGWSKWYIALKPNK